MSAYAHLRPATRTVAAAYVRGPDLVARNALGAPRRLLRVRRLRPDVSKDVPEPEPFHANVSTRERSRRRIVEWIPSDPLEDEPFAGSRAKHNGVVLARGALTHDFALHGPA